jgi:hypothetical protein
MERQICHHKITTAFVQQYSANIQMLSQQMGSLLRDKVRLESVVGKNAFFDQVGSVTAVLKTSRHSDTPQIDTPHCKKKSIILLIMNLLI